MDSSRLAHIIPDVRRGSRHADVACSFCDLPQASVKKLIKGPKGIFLCDTCVADCAALVEGNDPHDLARSSWAARAARVPGDLSTGT
ncbi:ClpX C4-type zinc finger protein [Polyangium jinanense]|nr:ClpX C4-type zinc finger protein [Polyangium jinanense]